MGRKQVAICDGPHCGATQDIDAKKDGLGWPDAWIVIDVKRVRDVTKINGMTIIGTGEKVFHSSTCLARWVALWCGTAVPASGAVTVTYLGVQA